MSTIAVKLKRIHENRFLRFAFVGTFGFSVNWVTLYVALHGLDLDKVSAWFVGFLVSVTVTWWGNRTLTFSDRAAGRGGLVREWFVFLVSNGLGGLANFITYFVLVTFVPPPLGNPLLAIVAGTLVGLVFNFTVSSRVVFRKKG